MSTFANRKLFIAYLSLLVVNILFKRRWFAVKIDGDLIGVDAVSEIAWKHRCQVQHPNERLINFHLSLEADSCEKYVLISLKIHSMYILTIVMTVLQAF